MTYFAVELPSRPIRPLQLCRLQRQCLSCVNGEPCSIAGLQQVLLICCCSEACVSSACCRARPAGRRAPKTAERRAPPRPAAAASSLAMGPPMQRWQKQASRTPWPCAQLNWCGEPCNVGKSAPEDAMGSACCGRVLVPPSLDVQSCPELKTVSEGCCVLSACGEHHQDQVEVRVLRTHWA